MLPPSSGQGILPQHNAASQPRRSGLESLPPWKPLISFITVFTRARHWSLSWARWIQSTPSHHTSLISSLILCIKGEVISYLALSARKYAGLLSGYANALNFYTYRWMTTPMQKSKPLLSGCRPALERVQSNGVSSTVRLPGRMNVRVPRYLRNIIKRAEIRDRAHKSTDHHVASPVCHGCLCAPVPRGVTPS